MKSWNCSPIILVTWSSQNWVKKTQTCISCTTGGKNIKIRNYNNFNWKFFFWRKIFGIFIKLILFVTSLFQNWNYQGRTYIWGAFFNFAKLQDVLITDWAGYLTEELLSRVSVFTEHHYWLIINDQVSIIQ